MTVKRYNLAWVLTRRKRFHNAAQKPGMMCREIGTHDYFFLIHVESGSYKVLSLAA